MQYCIAGILVMVNILFFQQQINFCAFYFHFRFISTVLQYRWPHPFYEISFFGLILE